jgi:hypothetical protein
LVFIPAEMIEAYQPLDRYIFGVMKAAAGEWTDNDDAMTFQRG